MSRKIGKRRHGCLGRLTSAIRENVEGSLPEHLDISGG